MQNYSSNILKLSIKRADLGFSGNFHGRGPPVISFFLIRIIPVLNAHSVQCNNLKTQLSVNLWIQGFNYSPTATSLNGSSKLTLKFKYESNFQGLHFLNTAWQLNQATTHFQEGFSFWASGLTQV